MKNILLTAAIIFGSLGAGAQGYETIKNMLVLGKAQQAKTELDKSMKDALFAGKPEAFMLKA